MPSKQTQRPLPLLLSPSFFYGQLGDWAKPYSYIFLIFREGKRLVTLTEGEEKLEVTETLLSSDYVLRKNRIFSPILKNKVFLDRFRNCSIVFPFSKQQGFLYNFQTRIRKYKYSLSFFETVKFSLSV